MDVFLSRYLAWLLFLVSLVFFDFVSALYFLFCWLVSGFIDRKLLRVEREETLRHAGVPEDQIDGRLIGRDRGATLARGAFAFGVGGLFHFFA